MNFISIPDINLCPTGAWTQTNVLTGPITATAYVQTQMEALCVVARLDIDLAAMERLVKTQTSAWKSRIALTLTDALICWAVSNVPAGAGWYSFLVACYATLYPALLVCWSVHRSVGPSHLIYFWFCGFQPHCSCPNDEVTTNRAPAHLHATGVAVQPALFYKNITFWASLQCS